MGRSARRAGARVQAGRARQRGARVGLPRPLGPHLQRARQRRDCAVLAPHGRGGLGRTARRRRRRRCLRRGGNSGRRQRRQRRQRRRAAFRLCGHCLHAAAPCRAACAPHRHCSCWRVRCRRGDGVEPGLRQALARGGACPRGGARRATAGRAAAHLHLHAVWHVHGQVVSCSGEWRLGEQACEPQAGSADRSATLHGVSRQALSAT